MSSNGGTGTLDSRLPGDASSGDASSCWPGTPDSVIAVAARDGVDLVVEEFAPHAAPRTVLVFLHGIGSYAGPYRRFARQVAGTGVFVYLPDLRGHGRSGTRGRMGSPSTVLSDIQVLIEHARAVHPDCDLVLGGESMGGLFATAYAASGRPAPDRLLLVAPALAPAWGEWVKVVLSRRSARGAAGDRRGSIPLHSSMPGAADRNPGFRDLCHEADDAAARNGRLHRDGGAVQLGMGHAIPGEDPAAGPDRTRRRRCRGRSRGLGRARGPRGSG